MPGPCERATPRHTGCPWDVQTPPPARREDAIWLIKGRLGCDGWKIQEFWRDHHCQRGIILIKSEYFIGWDDRWFGEIEIQLKSLQRTMFGFTYFNLQRSTFPRVPYGDAEPAKRSPISAAKCFVTCSKKQKKNILSYTKLHPTHGDVRWPYKEIVEAHVWPRPAAGGH